MFYNNCFLIDVEIIGKFLMIDNGAADVDRVHAPWWSFREWIDWCAWELLTGSDDYLPMPFIVNTLRWHTEIFVVYPIPANNNDVYGGRHRDGGEGDFLSERLSRNTSFVLFIFI